MLPKEIKDPIYLFHNGTNYEAHRLFSPRRAVLDGEEGFVFRVWAPDVESVSIAGDFNGWDKEKNPMRKISDEIYEGFVPGLKVFDTYKYCLTDKKGGEVFKADPYAYHAETAPQNASKLYDIGGFLWSDADWMRARESFSPYSAPINIYEMHLGSWRKNPDGSVKSYGMIADELIPYIKETGYTHVELLPVTEFPFDGSWGYQVTGMFAPTSRFGTPHDFMSFVDRLHKAKIGVILDWVAAHFPKDEHGLFEFNGKSLYEYTDPLKREHYDWGTMVFDYGRKEVKSFLISSAEYFAEFYHIDGIRVDAVASMLYLDYGRQSGKFAKNKDGGNYNLEAIEFLRELNTVLLSRHKGLLMIAEESTAFPLITKPAYDGGLGFNFKWNMGWMNDTLSYAALDPFFRKDNHNLLTFPITYAYAENYILPFSHDEVVHGKRSMINKMPGSYGEKFGALKALMSYMIAEPGKKLLFMGGEFAQFIEWDYKKELDWGLLEYQKHKEFHNYIKALNKLYLRCKPLHENDCSFNGYKWIVVDDKTQNIIAFKRFDSKGNYIIAVINFSPVERQKYDIGMSDEGTYKVILNSDAAEFGGKTESNSVIRARKAKKKTHGEDFLIRLKIPANGAMFIRKVSPRTAKTEKKGKAEK
ncbi:MAG: 1,4-alpha-glucan branching protein GlgB [Clostridiales bacterium]|jgi:1,4-alpha-glucan branching enzyme|nr:1,4-alpha-glucan branching protein GlgB [Clostridiales bacterium]